MLKNCSILPVICLMWAEAAPAQYSYAPMPQMPVAPQVMVYGSLPGQRWSGNAIAFPPAQSPPRHYTAPSPARPPAPSTLPRLDKAERKEVSRRREAGQGEIINAVCNAGEGIFPDDGGVVQTNYETPMPISPVVPVTPAVVVPKFHTIEQPKPGPYVVQIVDYEHGVNLAVYGFTSLLLWGFKEQNSPPLLTENAVVVAGAGDLPRDGELHAGLRAALGAWLNGTELSGVEFHGLYFVPKRSTVAFASNGEVALARPFINAIFGNEDQVLLSGAGQVGGAEIADELNAFWGLELNLRQRLVISEFWLFDCLAGVRYLHLDESLNVRTFTQFGVAPPPFSAAFIATFDEFRTKNHVVAPQIGFSSEWRRGSLYTNLWSKLGVGVVQGKTLIDGQTRLTGPLLGDQLVRGGVLALDSNIGGGQREHFTLVPEFGLNVGYDVGPQCRIAGGFSLLYISDIYRPGEQMDEVANPNLIPSLTGGPPGISDPESPRFPGARTAFWAQGLNLQVEFRY